MVFTNQNKQASFASGAVILAISAIVVKLIGVCYKIPLMRLIGAQGMGYFNTAYDVYALLCLLSTTGLPVAVSVVINRHPSQHRRIFRLSLIIFAVLGIWGMGTACFAADRIAAAVGAPDATQSLRFIAPAVLFICLSGAMRGYYQAQRNMLPTAISQVVEAAGKLLFGLLFAYLAVRADHPPAIVAAYAILGVSIGTLLCMLYLMLCHKQDPQAIQLKESSVSLIGELLKVAFPVTLGAILAGFSKVLDLSLIMRRLQDAGIQEGSAIAMYGAYSSMVVPLFSAVPVLFSSLALPLVPHLGHAIQNNQIHVQKQILQTAFRWASAISIPACLGMAMLSPAILQLLFAKNTEIAFAIPMLLIISIAIPASCLITVSNAVLQAYGHPWFPMLSTALGCAVKAICLYTLCIQPSIGILAAPISTVLCCAVTATCNLAALGSYTPTFGLARSWTYALAASAVSVGIAALLCKNISSCAWQVLLAIPTAILLYLPIAYKCGLIRISDIQSLRTQE